MIWSVRTIVQLSDVIFPKTRTSTFFKTVHLGTSFDPQRNDLKLIEYHILFVFTLLHR